MATIESTCDLQKDLRQITELMNAMTSRFEDRISANKRIVNIQYGSDVTLFVKVCRTNLERHQNDLVQAKKKAEATFYQVERLSHDLKMTEQFIDVIRAESLEKVRKLKGEPHL